MRFVVDVCVSQAVTEYLLKAGCDVIRIVDIDSRLRDEQILEFASEERCVLITNDKDFGRHIVLRKQSHCGLIRLPNASGDNLVRMMKYVIDRYADELERGAVVTVTRRHVRIRHFGAS